jgi:hypothetical protein
MTKPAGYLLGLPLLVVSSAVAGAQESRAIGQAVASSALSADTSSWPWIAVVGLFVTLGAIALVSRRRMPFGNRD